MKIEIESREPLGTLDSWSSPDRYFSEYFVIHPTCPQNFREHFTVDSAAHCAQEPLRRRLPNATPKLVLHNGKRMRMCYSLWGSPQVHDKSRTPHKAMALWGVRDLSWTCVMDLFMALWGTPRGGVPHKSMTSHALPTRPWPCGKCVTCHGLVSWTCSPQVHDKSRTPHKAMKITHSLRDLSWTCGEPHEEGFPISP